MDIEAHDDKLNEAIDTVRANINCLTNPYKNSYDEKGEDLKTLNQELETLLRLQRVREMKTFLLTILTPGRPMYVKTLNELLESNKKVQELYDAALIT